jgi:hypothetical protein
MADPAEKNSFTWDRTLKWWVIVIACAGLGYAMLNAAYLGNTGMGVLVFVSGPFFAGGFTGYYLTKSKFAYSGTCFAVLAESILITLALMLQWGEGLFCVLTAMPIWLAFAFVGTLLGNSIAKHPRGHIVIVGVLPLSLVGGRVIDLRLEPATRLMQTTIYVDAGVERVWPLLFELQVDTPPDTWYFRAGVACPVGTNYDSLSKTRTCQLTTGDLVERVTLAKENQELRWRVVRTPNSVKELNPFTETQPSHLSHSFSVLEGGFTLTAVTPNRTRLTGWTTYRSALGPDIYWDHWNRTVVAGVQWRVMNEISKQAERGTKSSN